MGVDLTEVVSNVTKTIRNGVKVPEIKAEDIIYTALKAPGIKISREQFLKKELELKYSPEVVEMAIIETPALAGVSMEDLKKISDDCINWETNKSTALSFASGLPGGFAMAAAIPADVTQYYGHMLRVLQKISYLYGLKEFDINENSIKDSTMSQLLVLLGVMMGFSQANSAIRVVAKSASNRAAKVIASKALTKTTVYPIVKQAAKVVGVKMTKQIFAKGVSKAIPIVGGVISGGLTYISFKPGAERLRNSFIELAKENVV